MEHTDQRLHENRKSLWDSRSFRPSEVFTAYRETVAKSFMPWTPEKLDDAFNARIGAVISGGATAGVLELSPLIAERNREDIANSPFDCIYANVLLNGHLSIDQAGRQNILKPWDLVLYEGSTPVRLVANGRRYAVLSLMIPKTAFAEVGYVESHLQNVVIPNDALIPPLAQCISQLAHDYQSYHPTQVKGLIDAFASLVPIGCRGFTQNMSEPISRTANALLANIKIYLNDNLMNAELNIQVTAEKFGISTRHIQKLFAADGTTFTSFLVNQRLENIAADLRLFGRHKVQISTIAYRWGFADFSTFYRAFKAKFGCSPSAFRARW